MRRSRSAGGYPFPADPRLSAIDAHVFWRPEQAPGVLVIAAAPDGYPDAIVAGSLDGAKATDARGTTHVALGPPGRDQQVVLQGELTGEAPLALVLPFDSDLPLRLQAASQLWRSIKEDGGERANELSAQRRARLLESLRALDGREAGASIRQIAAAFFGAENLPSGRDWRAHDLRSRTKRLVDAGRQLARGGYLALIRPARPRR